jgi:perosamine synthetase
MSVSDTARHKADEVIFEEYPEVGYNYRMSDVHAAIGIAQLSRLDEILAARRMRAKKYRDACTGHPLIATYQVPAWMRPNWQSFPVFIGPGCPCNQKQLLQALLNEGIAARRGIMNAHQEMAYGGETGALPESERARDHTILLPLYPSMTDTEQDTVIRAMLRLCR